MKGFSESIGPENVDPGLPAIHNVFSTTEMDLTKEQKAAVEKNEVTVAGFTLKFKTVVLMNLVNEAITTEYPKGLVHLIAKEISIIMFYTYFSIWILLR